MIYESTTSMGSDSEDDAPILAGRRAARAARASVKSYSISSDEDGASDGDDAQLSKQPKSARRAPKGSAKGKDKDDGDDDDVTDLTAESPKKKAKREPKVEAKVDEVSDLDDDEEALLLKLMSKHTPTASSSKAASATPAGKSAGAHKSAPVSAKKMEERGGQAAATTAPFEEDVATLGSARVESSKIKFSRSVPVLAPNPKKISRATFLVQCEDPSLDFDGDSGVIGTIKSSSESALQLDIKGQLFEGSVLPCNSMMVVDIGASEVKIEALMNNFVQLHKIQNPHDDNCDVDLSDSGDDQDHEDDEAAAKGSKAKDKGKAKAKAKGGKGKTGKAKASKAKAKKATAPKKKN